MRERLYTYIYLTSSLTYFPYSLNTSLIPHIIPSLPYILPPPNLLDMYSVLIIIIEKHLYDYNHHYL